MNFILSLFMLVVSKVFAQIPTPCTSPPQWEARLFEFDPETGYQSRAKFSYDSLYKRERTAEEVQLGKDTEFLDVLRLYNQNTEYVYNFKFKNCTKSAITRPWRNLGIPQNATFFGEAYVGSSAVPGANVLVTLWGDKFQDEKGNEIDYFGTWTYEACIPVSIQYYSQADKFDLHIDNFDVTPGIEDPNVFLPRPECLSL